MTRVVVGLDVGTTSAKAAAFDAAGRVLGSGEVAHRLDEPAPGQAVQDPDAVVDAAVDAARQAIAAARDAGAHVAGLAASTAMHGLVALGADGRPITPLITWGDRRAAEQAERLRAERPDLHERTGTPLHPMSPLTKIVWFREREPATFAAAARWSTLKELLARRLTGELVVDHSVASGTGLMELRRLAWDPEALAVAGIRAEQLARLAPATQALALTPDAARELGVDPATPFVLGGGDGPLANLGVGAVQPGVAACSIGTSAALRLVVEDPAVDPEHRLFCYALVPRRWVVGGAINNGGEVLRWAGEALAPDLGDHDEDELLALAAQAPPGSDGLLMLPYLLGERAPRWSTLPRGAYIGLTRAHRRPHLVRAALEGVCQQLALVLASMRDAGYEVREIRATGGFARAPLWRQMLADVLGMPIGFAAYREGSAFGAALLGMRGLGLVDTIDHAAELAPIVDVVEPDPDAAAVYAAMRPTFDGLFHALSPAWRALAEVNSRT